MEHTTGQREKTRAAEEMSIMAEIGRVISSTLEIDKVYETFAAEVRKLIPFDRIAVNTISPDSQTFKIAYVSGFDIPDRHPGDSFPGTGTFSETVARERTGVLYLPTKVEDFLRYPGSLTLRYGLNSMITVPLITGGTVIGALHIRSKAANAYSESFEFSNI